MPRIARRGISSCLKDETDYHLFDMRFLGFGYAVVQAFSRQPKIPSRG